MIRFNRNQGINRFHSWQHPMGRDPFNLDMTDVLVLLYVVLACTLPFTATAVSSRAKDDFASGLQGNLTLCSLLQMFRRKKWKYLILDEAHMIKNWKSQRWQTLLRFNSKRRLLITGTPLQVGAVQYLVTSKRFKGKGCISWRVTLTVKGVKVGDHKGQRTG